MPILNYTTQINAEKTVSEIQRKLAKAGAQAVLSEYDDEGVMCALSFRLMVGQEMVFFRLPARIDKLYVVLQRDADVPRKLRTREQAARVSWRIIKDWIEAQLALVETDMVELTEVFLPYAQNPATGKTLYETFSDGGLKLLQGPA